MSEQKIHAAMLGVLRDVGAITKDKKNQQQGFQYRGIDQVYGEFHPLFAKHGIYCIPEAIDRQHTEKQSKSGGVLNYVTVTMRYHLVAEDGSEVILTTIGEGMDSGDKGTNKAMAIAHKYALLQAFCVPTEDMPDPDKESFEVSKTPEPKPTAVGEIVWGNEFIVSREEKPYKSKDGSFKAAWVYITASSKTCGTTNPEVDALVATQVSDVGGSQFPLDLHVKPVNKGKSFELMQLETADDITP